MSSSLIELRRALHRIPELGFEEEATRAAKLADLGVVAALDLLDVVLHGADADGGDGRGGFLRNVAFCLHEIPVARLTDSSFWYLLYRQQAFQPAIERFNEVLSLRDDDFAARVFVDRCQALKDTPPGEGWDGVFVMKTK